MDTVNRKVQMTLLGVVLATPFLVVASVVGAHITSLADNVRVDVLCVALALVSIAVQIVNRHFALQSKTVRVESSNVGANGHNDLSEESSINLSC